MRFWWFIAALSFLVLVLMWQFPYMAGNTERNANILYLVLMTALVGSSGALSRISLTDKMRDIAIWLMIFLGIALAYSYRADIKGSRLFGALVPNAVQVTADGEIRISRAEDGHFHLIAEINGQPESFLVDTGASEITLSPRAAYAAGFDPDSLNYSRSYQTANGTVSGAPVKLKTLVVGPVVLRDIPASVNKAEMDESLMGMTFLNQFRSYRVEDNQLTIQP